jgi:hypothetical protein
VSVWLVAAVGAVVWLVAAAGIGSLVGQCAHWSGDDRMLLLERLEDLAVAA